MDQAAYGKEASLLKSRSDWKANAAIYGANMMPCSKLKSEKLLRGQSSDKSSQDRLSSLEQDSQGKDEVDCWTGDAPISSLQATNSGSSNSSELPTRISPRRIKLRAATTIASIDTSPAHGSSNDPDWSPSESAREEAVSCAQDPAIQGDSPMAASIKSCDMLLTKRNHDTLLREAEIKRQKAATLVAIARSLSVDACRAAKRQRLQPRLSQKGSSCRNPMIGARVAVFWPNDKQYYKGIVAASRAGGHEQQIEYDDKWSEWLPLEKEQFRLITPRGLSAGCNDDLLLLIYATCLKAQLQALHAEGLCQSKQPFNTKKTEHHPEGTAALGWLVSVECPADGQQYQGQLIAYAAETGLHHVLYVDGEDEWLSIGVEQIDWIRHIENPMPAGIKPGESAPTREMAVGWKVAVYWKHSGCFAPASIASFNRVTNQHGIEYDSGEEEQIALPTQCLKFLQAPPNPQLLSMESPERPEGVLISQQSIHFDRKWAFKTSRPRSSRIGSNKRQLSWHSLDSLAQQSSGVPTRKKEEQSPVSRLFEYLGPAQNKLPLQTAKQTAATYPSQAVHTPQSAEQELSKKAAQHLEADALCHLPDKVIHGEHHGPWRMGSPFEGLDFASGQGLQALQFVKAEAEDDRQLGLQLEDKLLDLDGMTPAPSPAPLLEHLAPSSYHESMLMTAGPDCIPSLHGNMGSGKFSSNSLDISEDYLDINLLMDSPIEPCSSTDDWYSLDLL